MAAPVVAQKSPFSTDVVAGRTYGWFACGRSSQQPFKFNPDEFKPDMTEQFWFCGRMNPKTAADAALNALAA